MFSGWEVAVSRLTRLGVPPPHPDILRYQAEEGLHKGSASLDPLCGEEMTDLRLQRAALLFSLAV